MAPASTIYDPSTSWGTIRFGALSFAKHLPALHSDFNILHEGVNLTFGGFRFHVTQLGTIRVPDLVRLHEMMPDLPSRVTLDTSSAWFTVNPSCR